MVNGPARVARVAPEHPASYVGFDVLAHAGVDQRRRPWSSRRLVLEGLADGWVPPLQLSPVTRDLGEANRRCRDYRVAGIEGLVVKGAPTRFAPPPTPGRPSFRGERCEPRRGGIAWALRHASSACGATDVRGSTRPTPRPGRAHP